jgi:hypothetical protein
MYSKIIYYVLYLAFFITSQMFSMWGQYITLPLTELTHWEAYKMAIPYAWTGWIFMTIAININSTYKLTTPIQVILLLMIVQSLIMVIINKYYFNKPLFNSDILGFVVMLFGFYVSLYHIVSHLFKLHIPEHVDKLNISDVKMVSKNMEQEQEQETKEEQVIEQEMEIR